MGGWQTLIGLNSYVVVLLEYCALFFVVMVVGRRLKLQTRTTDAVLIGGVVVSSVVLYFFFDKSGWCWERWGLIYGLLVWRHHGELVAWLERNRKVKAGIFVVMAMVAGLAYLRYKPVYFYGEFVLKLVLGVLLIMALFLLTSGRRWMNVAVSLLGGISYEVYLSHGFIMDILSRHTALPSGAFVVAAVGITVLFSCGVHCCWSRPLVGLLRA